MMKNFQEIKGCLQEHIGSMGLTETELSQGKAKALQNLKELSLLSFAPLRIVQNEEDIPSLLSLAQEMREKFSRLLVFGTGGSSLGGQTLSRLAPRCPHSSRLLPSKPEVQYVDNIDPDTFAGLFPPETLEKTGVLLISKSGETAETLMQMLYAFQAYEKAGLQDKISSHFYVITEDKPSSMRQLAQSHAIPSLAHDPHIGGRFSIFSNVALLPAAVEGVDIKALRQGAARSLEQAVHSPETHDAVEGAALAAGLAFHRSIHTTVLMPYLDKMNELGLWYRQLWAESLGKNKKGTTPLLSPGTVDQHSQLQLYLDGPKDKMFTVLFPSPHHTGPVVEDSLLPSLEFFKGRTMADLLQAEAQATVVSLKEKGCPTRCLFPGPYTEDSLGFLLMHFMIETLLTASLWEVDPWTQPAVERGKVLARDFMRRHHESSYS